MTSHLDSPGRRRTGAARERGMATAEYAVATLGACSLALTGFFLLRGWLDEEFLRLVEDAYNRTLVDLFEIAWHHRPKLMLR